MKFFSLFSSKKTQNWSFTQKTVITLMPYNLISAVLLGFYISSFISIRQHDRLFLLAGSAIIIFITQCIVTPIVHKMLSQSISGRLKNLDAIGMDIKERTAFVKDIVRFPLKIGFASICIFILCIVTMAMFMKFTINFKHHFELIIIKVGMPVSYFSFLLTFNKSQKICSATAEKVARDGLDNREIEINHYFGASMRTRFIIYVILPLVVCSFMTYYVAHIRVSVTFLSSIAVINSAVVSGLTYLFFGQIKNYTTQMNAALGELLKNKSSSTSFFPTDFSTNISYTMYLLNKTIALFKSLVENTASINTKLNEAVSSLSSVSTETSSTATEQAVTSKTVQETMENLKTASGTIQAKVQEVMNVANKTSEQVEINFNRLEENLSKLKEITATNDETIHGIQNLSAKIAAIQDITSLINTVASQTKIIAFNAELEAVSTDAQEFEEVAKEIRILADNTMSLTKEIKDTISEIEEAIAILIKTGKDCTAKIEEGNEISAQLEKHFFNIQKSAQDTTSTASKIYEVTGQQTLSFNSIVILLQDISRQLTDFSNASKTITNTVANLNTQTQAITMQMSSLADTNMINGAEK